MTNTNSWKFHRNRFNRYSRAARDMLLADRYGRLALTIADRDDDHRFAYTLAFVVLYTRPFTRARGWPKMDETTLPYTPEEFALHRELRDARDQLWAHTDSSFFEALPIVDPEVPEATLHIEHWHGSIADEVIRDALAMAEKAGKHFESERRQHREFLEMLGDVVYPPPKPNEP